MKLEAPRQRKLGVGILGAGTVGGGLIRLIQEGLAHRAVAVEIKKVGVRSLVKPRSFTLPDHLLTSDLKPIVDDPEIDIIVEAMGGLEPARSLIERALRAGKHVVTANKHVVSEWGEQLHQLAAAKGCSFLYEASVAGSIPIIEILKEGVIPDRIHSVYAILNGTTNFILTRMTESGEDFHAALAKAQELGFSEPDPSFDITGKDAGQKLSILISILKNQHCHPAQIDIRGIDFLMPWDFQFAAERQWVIKPLSIYEEVDGFGFACVEPVFVPRQSVFASARNEYNALCLDCQHIGQQILIGKGAGELPTASALLSDLRKIAESPGRPQTLRLQTEPGTLTQFRSSIENPKSYRFYVSCCPRQPEKRRKIYEVFSIDSELIQERSPCARSGFRLAVVTKAIPHSELFRILDLVLSFDPDAEVSWVRILEAI
ncbi:MAG: homoserine dehydrogenase [Acidobacteria bacterium]|nr:homoserine dehydrogenase [Acidobacteriota bacterium]MCI0720072.1 homoserine dehydrogenase [Acidobacteriota bacterium]